jgi:hypothetical protein
MSESFRIVSNIVIHKTTMAVQAGEPMTVTVIRGGFGRFLIDHSKSNETLSVEVKVKVLHHSR